MFARFSASLYTQAASQEYRLTHGGTDDLSKAGHMILQKVEMATLINLHILQGELISNDWLVQFDKVTRQNAEQYIGRVGQVAFVYVIAGGETPSWEGAEEYHGQPVYSVYWHVNPATGEVSAPKGHPKKLFGLDKMIKNAYAETDMTTSMKDLMQKVDDSRLKPKYSYPLLTYGIILINAIVLGLMYLDGFPGDPLVPMRFGAIVPGLIHERVEWYRLFTAMFIHFGIGHFAANALGLFIFGSRVEMYFGRLAFLLIYVIAGLLGSVFSLYLSQAYSAGASGAVYALIGAIFAYTRITKRTIGQLDWYMMFMFVGIGIAMGFVTPGVDNFAHLGGLLGGMVLGGFLRPAKH